MKLESGGGYVPAPAVNFAQIQNTSLDPLVAPMNTLPKPGELLLPGPLDVTADTVFSASPLYGTRQWQLNNANENIFSGEENNMQFSPSGPVEQGRTANMSRVQQYRNELNQSVNPGLSPGGPVNGPNNSAGSGAGNGTGNGTTGGAARRPMARWRRSLPSAPRGNRSRRSSTIQDSRLRRPISLRFPGMSEPSKPIGNT